MNAKGSAKFRADLESTIRGYERAVEEKRAQLATFNLIQLLSSLWNFDKLIRVKWTVAYMNTYADRRTFCRTKKDRS